MKKLLSLIIALIMCVSLTSCGKSKEVKNVESAIDNLSSRATYRTIHEAYELYTGLESKDKEKVENIESLKKHISLYGHFVLTDEMISEIKKYYISDAKAFDSYTKLRLSSAITIEKGFSDYAKDWDKIDSFIWSSEEKTDDYTYTKYGKVKISTKYGDIKTHNFKIEITANYEEATGLYELTHMPTIEK